MVISPGQVIVVTLFYFLLSQHHSAALGLGLVLTAMGFAIYLTGNRF